ncbi:MAG: YlcI/YnfO family protein, partial [Dysosmobacter sp.]|nr:YlcI/YnfO family protein [Dysosmobacter sp.]
MAFRIPKIPPTSVKSIRFPNPMIEEVEAAIQGQDCTFSAFVVAAVQAARDHRPRP